MYLLLMYDESRVLFAIENIKTFVYSSLSKLLAEL